MPVNELRAFLDKNGVRYVSIRHSPAYTAQEAAASAHVAGRKVAKTVIVVIDGRMAMAVLPATEKITFSSLKAVTGARQVRLAGEDEIGEWITSCEPGAAPPFGNLYGMETYVSPDLKQTEIAFNGGSFNELVVMYYDDYVRLVRPKVLSFAHPSR